MEETIKKLHEKIEELETQSQIFVKKLQIKDGQLTAF